MTHIDAAGAIALVQSSIPEVINDLIEKINSEIIKAAKKCECTINFLVPKCGKTYEIVKQLIQYYEEQGFKTRSIFERIEISWIP